jgi:hypothetical protein
MLLPTNHKDHVLDDSVLELLLRRAVDGMRKVDIAFGYAARAVAQS